jgi:hypothetical protein
MGIDCCGAAKASAVADGNNAFNKHSNRTAATRLIARVYTIGKLGTSQNCAI